MTSSDSAAPRPDVSSPVIDVTLGLFAILVRAGSFYTALTSVVLALLVAGFLWGAA